MKKEVLHQSIYTVAFGLVAVGLMYLGIINHDGIMFGRSGVMSLMFLVSVGCLSNSLSTSRRNK